MSDFKGRRFPTDVILLCVRWYCKLGISYRDLEEMSERGSRSIIRRFFRWVQHYDSGVDCRELFFRLDGLCIN